MDLFDKCFGYNRNQTVDELGCYPYFLPISENHGPVVRMNGRDVIMAGSNNYLGLTMDPQVQEAACAAVRRYGTGCSGSRLLNGSYEIHLELEKALADFLGKESALLFSTGFQTNQGCIVPLIGRGDVVLTDKENHASIVQGTLIVKSLLGAGSVVRYRHNDMAHLERHLAALPKEAGKLIVSDGVFSMVGDIVDLPGLVRLARAYGARVLIDDAHGLGVLGGGGGTARHFGLDHEVDIVMGTFSKSFASLGGFIAARKEVINYIKHHSPAQIFSASLTPAQVATVLKSLEIIRQEPERIRRLMDVQKKVRRGLQGLGFQVPDGETPIVPVVLGDDMLTFRTWKTLFDKGIYTNAIISPAVPPGMQLLRLSFMSTHEDAHVDRLLEAFAEVRKDIPRETGEPVVPHGGH